MDSVSRVGASPENSGQRAVRGGFRLRLFAPLVVGCVCWIALPANADGTLAPAATVGDGSIDAAVSQRVAAGEVPEGLTAGGWAQIRERIERDRYQARWAEKTPLDGVGGAWVAGNPSQGLNAYFDGAGLHLASRDEATWQLGMRLTGWGWEGAVQPVESADPEVEGSRVEYRRGTITEWYLNDERGLEQGFTVDTPPEGLPRSETLVLELALSGDLEAQSSMDGQAFVLRHEGGDAVLRYAGLVAWDSDGRKLSSHIEVFDGAVVLSVEAGDARFPITVDPLFTQVAKLLPSFDVQDDVEFGCAVAISGDTAVVGARYDDHAGGSNAGSAYVFTRSGTTWSEEQKLVASDAAADDRFGNSVALSGDTAVVGAYDDDHTGGVDAGSAYVFTRTGTTWSDQQKLVASDAAASDFFGISVAISGDTVVVGTSFDDHAGGTNAGSAYVFTRSGTTWSEQQKLTANDGAAYDSFGISVALSGDSAVVGASFDDHAGGSNAGSAYVFTRSGTTWSEEQKLVASDAAAYDYFGDSVALSGDTAVVGAYVDDHAGGTDAGSGYVFTRTGTTWSEEQKLVAGDAAASDYFGIWVAISGDTVVVGAYGDDHAGGSDAGSAYVFTRTGTTWSEEQKLAASNTAAFDSFGVSVAISGDTAVVGAHSDDHAGGIDAGSAYVFMRSGTTWSEEQKLFAGDAAGSDSFGISVAISGDTVVVGAPFDDHAGGTDAGSAYVFTRSGTTWSEEQQLTASDAAAFDSFGISVAITGDTVVVGAYGDDHAGGADAGSAYVFTRFETMWSEEQKLVAGDAAGSDSFGISVAISGDTVVVGASFDDHAGGTDAGSAYVFTRSGTMWSEEQKLVAGDAAGFDSFGTSVAISGDTAVVGASGDDHAGGTDAGSAYGFTRSGTTWSEEQKLVAGDAAAADFFGISVAISGGTAVVGAIGDTHGSKDIAAGSAYVFEYPRADLAITKDDGLATAVPGQPVTYTISAFNSAGPIDAPGATVADEFPPELAGCSWTCVGAGGGACTAGPVAGDISDSVDLPVGGSVTYTATCTVDPGVIGSLVNTATVTPPAGISDPDPGNNTATDVDTLTPTADLAIAKDDGQATAVPGEPVTYTIVASNAAGPSAAPGASAIDTFPPELTGCMWTCVGSGGAVCAVSGAGNINDTPSLPVGGSATYVATCTVDLGASGSLVNTATITAPAGVIDPNLGNNSATDTDNLTPEADLAITKDDGQTTALPGDPVTYTITASNAAGPSDAPGAAVSDAFPAELTGCAWTCAGSGGATCAASGTGDINDVPDLPAGGTATYTVDCTVDPGATGSVANTATVTAPAGVTDPNAANDSATDTDTLTPEADLAITKDDRQTTAVPGGPLTYTITVSNSAGPSDAPGATVSDAFPAELTGCAWTCAGSGGATCAASGAGDINDTANLPVGGSATYTVDCAVDPAATGSLANTATVTVPPGVTDPNPANDSATDTDTLTPEADLSITKDDGQTTVLPGETLTYTITASNSGGPSDAPGTTVSDTFPAELTGCSWTCVAIGGATCTASGAGDINDVPDLPAGGTVTYTVDCTVDPGATGSVANTATVTAPAGINDPNAANDSATDTDTILELDFGDAPDPTFATLLASDGARHAIAGGLYLGSVVDGELDGQPTPTADGDDIDGSDDEDGVVFTTGPVAGEQGSVAVSASAAGVLNAWLDLDGDGDWGDVGEQIFTDEAVNGGINNLSVTVPADAVEGNSVSRFRLASTGGLSATGLAMDGEVEDSMVAIARECDLELFKSAWVDPAVAGLGLRYTVTATNLGPSDASDVTVIDILPAAASFLNAVPGSPTCEESAGEVTCVLGDVADGASSDVIITVLVDPAASGTITNSADGSADETDPTPGNNTASVDTGVVVPLFADAFESGDTTAWTSTVPGYALRKVALAEPVDDYWTSFRVDEELVRRLGPAPAVLVAGVGGDGAFVFVVEAAWEPEGLSIHLEVRLGDGSWIETGWALIGSHEWMEVEWRRAMPEMADGYALVRVNGSIMLAARGLDNALSAVHALAVAEKDGRAAVSDLNAPEVGEVQ